MTKKQDRIAILEKLKTAAALYKKYLVGKTFLYVFDNRYIEVIYKADNFRHLTGVDTNLSAKQFYKLAVNRKLQATQIFFSARHPFGLCKRKVQHICQLTDLATSVCFLLEDITTKSNSYKFGSTDLNFTLCMNKEYDENGNEKGSCFVAESLRDEDCFNKSTNVYEVTHILAKNNDEKVYNYIIYCDSRYTMSDIPNTVKFKKIK